MQWILYSRRASATGQIGDGVLNKLEFSAAYVAPQYENLLTSRFYWRRKRLVFRFMMY
jgi:hypothetical protein